MHALPRFSSAMISASFVTLCLIYLMTVLIATDDVIVDLTPPAVIKLASPKEMEPVIPQRPKAVEPLPPEVMPPQPRVSNADPVFTAAPPSEKITLEPPKTLFNAIPDGEHLPLVRMQPSYPRQAVSRGTEGYTIVEFDISPQGFVQNPRIIEAYPSSVFDRSSLQAIQKFKYKPKVVDGQPQTVFGARNKFIYELSKG